MRAVPRSGRSPGDTDVIIVGAGPVGLLLAVELANRGIGCVVLEQRELPSEMPKANGLVGEIATVLTRRGVLRGVRGAHAIPVPLFPFGPVLLHLNPLQPRSLRVVPIPQRRLEHALDSRARSEGAAIRRGHTVTGFDDDGERVTVTSRSGGSESVARARYLVGCDGAHSFVRTHAAIGFPGITSDDITRIGEVTLAPNSEITAQKSGFTLGDGRTLTHFIPLRTATGSVMFSPAAHFDRTAAPTRFVVTTHEPRGSTEPATEISLDELRDSVRRVLGVSLPLTHGSWLRSTVAQSRLVDRLRVGRVLLAGDAAHVFSAGGSSLNVGMLDAVALAPRLASAVVDQSPPDALEGYHDERHAAGIEALVQTRAQAALSAPGPDADALREVLTAAFRTRRPQRYLARRLIGR